MTEIAIVGGGIGGLAAAAFLRRAGLDATVYEQASRLGEVGAGVVVAPNAARLLRALGVLGPFAERAVPLAAGWEFRRWRDGRVLSAEDLATECERRYGERRYGERTYTAHRVDLLGAISRAVPAGAVRLGRRCVRVETEGPRPRLWFADGEAVEADVVIGADGIHSTVRAALTGPAAAAYSGLCAFRALVPAEHAPSFARRPAQTLWTAGSTTLLGDAAHPMFPFFAQDAAVLARCLATTTDGPAAALRRYEELRIPRTARLQQVSHARADVNHLPDGPGQAARDAALATTDALAASAWIYEYDADDPLATAGS